MFSGVINKRADIISERHLLRQRHLKQRVSGALLSDASDRNASFLLTQLRGHRWHLHLRERAGGDLSCDPKNAQVVPPIRKSLYREHDTLIREHLGVLDL